MSCLSKLRFSVSSAGSALLFFLLLAGTTAHAEPSDQDLTALSLEELMKVKVVSASRHVEDAKVAPSAVTVITADEISRYGWRTMADILNSVRGFFTSYDRNYAYLGVRGFSRPGDQGARVLLMINGHRTNDNVYGGAAMGTDFPLDIDLIERIEIVRGPSSSLYGANAFFAIINVITRRPRHAPAEIESSGATSSYLTRTGRLTLSGERDKNSGLLSGTLYRSEGNPDLFYPEYATPATNNGHSLDSDRDSSFATFADVQLGSFRLQALGSSRQKTVPTGAYATNFNDPRTRVTDTNAYFDAGYHHETSSQTSIDVRAHYDAFQHHGTYALDMLSQQFVGYDQGRGNWVGTDLAIGQQLGKHRITVGGDYQYSINSDQENHYPFGGAIIEPLNDHRTPSSAGVYGQAEIALASKLKINAGGRFDWFSTFGSMVSPRVAVIFLPTSKTSLRYIYGQAFNAPTSFELYHSDGVAYTSNPLLKPELIRSNEVILEHDLARWLRFSADAFYNQMRNLIDTRLDPGSGLMQFVNVNHDSGRGLEFELEAKRASGLRTRVSYTLADSQDDLLHARLANAPLHMAKLNAAIPVGKRTFAGVELQYTSPQRSFQDTRVGDALVANFTVSTKPLWQGFEFAASCYNLLDRRYFTPTGVGLVQPAILQDGRTFRFKITHRIALPRTGRGPNG
jgi:iron complex outermembrane receptor protein